MEKVVQSDLLVKADYLQENYYNKEEINELLTPLQPEKIDKAIQALDILDGDESQVGSVKYQINEAKLDLIGDEGDQSSQDTINAAKNLVADSLQFIIYN